MVLGFVIHGSLLGADYQTLAGTLFRTEADSKAYFPFMLLAHLIYAAGFVCIYKRGKEAKPFLGQGLRYGLLIALVGAIPMYLIYYAVQPMPGDLVFKQMLFETVGLEIQGVVVAFLNKD